MGYTRSRNGCGDAGFLIAFDGGGECRCESALRLAYLLLLHSTHLHYSPSTPRSEVLAADQPLVFFGANAAFEDIGIFAVALVCNDLIHVQHVLVVPPSCRPLLLPLLILNVMLRFLAAPATRRVLYTVA